MRGGAQAQGGHAGIADRVLVAIARRALHQRYRAVTRADHRERNFDGAQRRFLDGRLAAGLFVVGRLGRRLAAIKASNARESSSTARSNSAFTACASTAMSLIAFETFS